VFDYIVLGDSQPEGLLLAAGLARRSYRVGLLPSKNLGELPPQDSWPIEFPENLGSKRLDELLFKVGFFRLEESGLSPHENQYQILLKRHRLNLNGSMGRWQQEVEREFPREAQVLVEFRKSLRSAPVNGAKRKGQSLQSLAGTQLALKQFLSLDGARSRPGLSHAQALQMSVESWSKDEAKTYRMNTKLEQPLNQYLTEHARKWGVQVLEEAVDLKMNWTDFELAEGVRSKNVIINSLAAGRALAKLQPTIWDQSISHWLYFDRLKLPLDKVPEPLCDQAYLQLNEDSNSAYSLKLTRDNLRDQAILTLGIWLPFSDSKYWIEEIERARDQLKKFMPFLPDGAFPEIPELLDLNEKKGECVRRGEIERLEFSQATPSRWKRIAKKICGQFGRKENSAQLSRRIFVSAPYLLGMDRKQSLKACLEYLEDKERRRPAATALGRQLK